MTLTPPRCNCVQQTLTSASPSSCCCPAVGAVTTVDCEPGDQGDSPFLCHRLIWEALSLCWGGMCRSQTLSTCHLTSPSSGLLLCIPGVLMALISPGCQEYGVTIGKPGLK